ncbi:hypothetical protein B0H19DRAFT_1267730 [Mycena capillaripes]|nr:hypothetical protein B0H19DRAFT_1267730 [Mycena capillaripes]
MNNNTIQLSWQLRVWNMTADASQAVNVLWNDHVGGTGNNASLNFLGVSTAAGRHSPSCITSMNATTDSPATGRVDVAVRPSKSYMNLVGVSPMRVYVEQMAKDSVQRPIIIEIDLASDGVQLEYSPATS